MAIITELTMPQKLQALAYRFYQDAEWKPKTDDYYTSSRDDLQLFRIVNIECGKVYTEYCEQPGAVSIWEENGFTSEGFGIRRVWVPNWILGLESEFELEPSK